MVIVFGAAVATVSEFHAQKLEAIAASPVYSSLSLLAQVAEQSAFIKELAESEGDPRSSAARRIVIVDEFEWSIMFRCNELTEAWDRWGLETDPRLRSDLEMVNFFCKQDQPAHIEDLRDASMYSRRRICETTGHQRACNPVPFHEIEDHVNLIYFSGSVDENE